MNFTTKSPLAAEGDALPGPSLREAVGRAVVSTSTSALRKHGIENLCVLSESRLLEILAAFLEEARRRRTPGESASSAGLEHRRRALLREMFSREI